MSGKKKLEVISEDRTPQKWCVSLREDVFDSFISQGSPIVQKVFSDGSLFSPLLFGKFFDPSDAFPLWEFESDNLLSGLRSSGKSTVDWFETDTDYVLTSELPGVGMCNAQVSVENKKVVEISGQWKQHRESNSNDWRNGNWWELGYVRRLELPENADWRKIEANLDNNILLEIRVPKISDIAKGNDAVPKDSEIV
ncbi:hypothetical protein HHK36_003476 [Tetracentron sinense]|uniref:SHSP domain-containing protein n=1 Tax=Tetracentron sinense TaxID=13715 RepID=A0A834ZNA5_TETSI|nr:hypothetical protein HHK36_003476 [Tetracentron sinense]